MAGPFRVPDVVKINSVKYVGLLRKMSFRGTERRAWHSNCYGTFTCMMHSRIVKYRKVDINIIRLGICHIAGHGSNFFLPFMHYKIIFFGSLQSLIASPFMCDIVWNVFKLYSCNYQSSLPKLSLSQPIACRCQVQL